MNIRPKKRNGEYEDPDDGLSVDLAADLGKDAPWSVMQIFHKYLEAERTIPDWPTFYDLVDRREADRIVGAYRFEFWIDYTDGLRKHPHFQELLRGRTEALASMLEIGLRWRLSNIYFSALRELELIILLRERFALDVKYHVLADTVFKADLWALVGNEVRTVAIYIRSDKLRRKQPLAKLLPPPDFVTRDIEVYRQPIRFAYWPITEASVEKVAGFFKAP
ncbi:MAG: hypothetical protein IAI50_19085 [Candidatus Eremiobacteraeota bacterium]|nr:hypothetical protein [Candidatus Eremiobacteraeota bacterium]